MLEIAICMCFVIFCILVVLDSKSNATLTCTQHTLICNGSFLKKEKRNVMHAIWKTGMARMEDSGKFCVKSDLHKLSLA
jgi:tRNA A22 N-methylase